MKFILDLFAGRASRLAQATDRIYKLEQERIEFLTREEQQEVTIQHLQLENRAYLKAVAMAKGETKLYRERAEQLAADLAAAVANASTDGPKADLEKGNDAQAARAMSRQTKQHFQAYQATVKMMLDQLNTIGMKNTITKEDIRRLRELRVDLGNQLGRSI